MLRVYFRKDSAVDYHTHCTDHIELNASFCEASLKATSRKPATSLILNLRAVPGLIQPSTVEKEPTWIVQSLDEMSSWTSVSSYLNSKFVPNETLILSSTSRLTISRDRSADRRVFILSNRKSPHNYYGGERLRWNTTMR